MMPHTDNTDLKEENKAPATSDNQSESDDEQTPLTFTQE